MNLRKTEHRFKNKKTLLVFGGIYVLNTDMFEHTLSSKYSVGICIKLYDDKSGLVLFDNGCADGFSKEDTKKYLNKIGCCDIDYTFKSMIALHHDWNNNEFKEYFNSATDMYLNSVFNKLKEYNEKT